MGSDTSKSSLMWQFAVPLKANAQKISAARAAGKDCKDLSLTLGGSAKKC